MHPKSKSHVWNNREPRASYKPVTVCGHAIKSNDVKDLMHLTSVENELAQYNWPFIRKVRRGESH